MALVDTEQITPLEEISKLYSSEASIIEKISKKWSDRKYPVNWDEIDERIYHLNDFVTQTIKQDCLEAGMDHLIKDIFERRDFYFN